MCDALFEVLAVELGKGHTVGSGPMNVAQGTRIQWRLGIQFEKSADSGFCFNFVHRVFPYFPAKRSPGVRGNLTANHLKKNGTIKKTQWNQGLDRMTNSGRFFRV